MKSFFSAFLVFINSIIFLGIWKIKSKIRKKSATKIAKSAFSTLVPM